MSITLKSLRRGKDEGTLFYWCSVWVVCKPKNCGSAWLRSLRVKLVFVQCCVMLLLWGSFFPACYGHHMFRLALRGCAMLCLGGFEVFSAASEKK